MIRNIVAFSLHQPLFIWLGLVLFIGSGFVAFYNLPIEAFPDVSDTQVSVITQYPGQAAEEIEKQITIPLEIGLSGLPSAIRMFSHTMFGLSYLMITFDDKVDPYFARQQVLERLQNIDMPPGINSEMAPLATAIGEIYRYKIASDYMSSMDLRTLQDWVVLRQLKQIPGVADIASIGGLIKQYQVHPDLKKMRDYQVSLEELFSAIERANANGGGGPVELGSQQFLLRGIGLLKSSTDISNIAITEREGVPILVKDIAEVVIEGPPRQGIMGEGKNDDLVSGIIMMRKGENPSVVLKAIKEKVDFLNQQVLPKGVSIVPYYDRSWLIQKTLHTVFGNLREGALLVAGVLFLFLGNLRAAIIVAIIIPLSLLATFIGLTWIGIPANLLSLGGMDFGIIVDGAVIVVENVFRKLGENKEILNHHDRKNKVLEAVTEVSRPTLFSMLIIIAAYIPIFTLQRHEGRIFSPMAYSVTAALVGALILSFTLVPLLCYTLLRKDLPHHENKLINQCKNIYQPLLLKALHHGKTIIFIAFISLLGSLGIAQKLGTEFLPELDEGAIWINIPLPPGISVSETQIATGKIRTVLQNIIEVDTVISKAGRPDDGTDPKLINSTEYLVNLKPQSELRQGYRKKDLIREMDQLLSTLPGIAPSFSQPIRDNVLESISQIKGQIVIKVFGDDSFILKDLAEQILRSINHIPGVAQAFIDQKGDLPQYLIEIDREDAAHYGLNVADLQDLVEVALGGRIATEFWEGERHFSIVVRLKDEDRSPARLQDILIDTPHGGPIPVSEVVDFHIASGAMDISRENGRPVIAIGIFIQDRDMGSVVADMQQQVAKTITLPKNYSITWSGEFESQKRAMNRLMLVIPLSILLIFILLFNAFNSFKNSLLIITNIPFALIGGILALYITGLPLSVSAAIGFIALFGQAVLNGVVLVTRFEQLRSKGKTLYQAVVEGSLQRLRTELMTASLAMLGLLPMALSNDIGSEVQRPLAIVIIGGLISATLLTLIVLPTLYLMFSEKPSNQKSITIPVS
ncbi:efflux RND transporter permease subunit [Candidatus Nitrosacidococcus sp. I8]|uniref:efflux RND transporter permease subunit n=1 Tax=Candidatus Nitrosacidococcus sp. I8 TaxID=2942908 RepID=UPI0022270588|nr:CusA/CzcA family heavy metal efflux RND transporter [Candidatus Nitrosacidococcus sp. I8]CAH9018078.1 Cobalt-zinc-cadmium resistance protein CzcA [Candidatus Nitrosacidococcus sp. I8]